MMRLELIDILGGVGISLILFGFYRTSIGKWTAKSFWYELDNLVGALLLGVYSLHHQAYISVVLDTIWAIVAVKGISSYRDRKHKKRRR